MVKLKKYASNILSAISLYAILVAALASVVNYFTNIGWSHLVAILCILYLYRIGKVNLNFIVTFMIFYFAGLMVAQRYDFDKVNEVLFYQLIPLMLMFILYLYVISSDIYNKVNDFLSKKLFQLLQFVKLTNLNPYVYLLIPVLIGYIVIFLFQDFLNIYGGLIVLFIFYQIVQSFLSPKRMKAMVYISTLVYILIYNLTLSHGMTLLMNEPLDYLYSYFPTLVIPVIFLYIFSKKRRKWDL